MPATGECSSILSSLTFSRTTLSSGTPVGTSIGSSDPFRATLICGPRRCSVEMPPATTSTATAAGALWWCSLAVTLAHGATYVCCYFSAIGRWSELATMESAVVLNVRRAMLVEQILFFTTHCGQGRIVTYHVLSSSISIIENLCCSSMRNIYDPA